MDQTVSTDTTATNAIPENGNIETTELAAPEAEAPKNEQPFSTPPAASSAPQPPADPPVGTTVADAEKAAQETPEGLDAKANTAGRVDEAQATVSTENAAGYRGVRTDPTPHSHYTVEGVCAGLPTPETNAGAAFLTGNRGRFADLDEDARDEHHNAEGVDEIAKRAQGLGLV